VHGQGGLGGLASRPAPGGKSRQKPTCTSCHQGHDLPAPESVAFRESLPDRCGNCHGAMSSSYALSMHGKLTDLGYGPAAKCADCHGSHDILRLDDPNSTLSPENRVHTCAKCHANAGANFVHFSPHIDVSDAKTNPVVHGVRVTLLTLLYSTFAFFGIHSLLWFIRGLVEVLKHGRPHGLRPGQTAYVRFVSFHRIGHSIMMTSFLGLALTGLPLKYHDAPWAKSLARFLGGFQSTGFWHRFFGVILLTSMLVYMARMVRLLVEGRKQGRTLMEMAFGSDSPLPTLRDLKDFLKMLRWFFGLGPRPGFDRWSYWEKIDFWGAIADTVIIGSTGLVLWFPNFFCGPLPGTALNIAMVIHSTQALLATGFVFAIHFFNTHFRPDRFPADMSVLSGLVSEEEFKEDRPEYFERLEREGKLEAMRTTSPGLFVLWSIRTFGFLALAIGLALLLGMIVASLG
jgi:cytochrome b subunit of formate dehydrogenase